MSVFVKGSSLLQLLIFGQAPVYFHEILQTNTYMIKLLDRVSSKQKASSSWTDTPTGGIFWVRPQ